VSEHAVANLAVDGLTNPAIAEHLVISRATVKTHLSHMYAKLGVKNRTELTHMSRAVKPIERQETALER